MVCVRSALGGHRMPNQSLCLRAVGRAYAIGREFTTGAWAGGLVIDAKIMAIYPGEDKKLPTNAIKMFQGSHFNEGAG
eukprot:732537-Pleurochrysis_carterae.AAC.1